MGWWLWQVKTSIIMLSGNQINIIREFKDGYYYKKIIGCYTSHSQFNHIQDKERKEGKHRSVQLRVNRRYRSGAFLPLKMENL
jgi:hypothetical protein